MKFCIGEDGRGILPERKIRQMFQVTILPIVTKCK